VIERLLPIAADDDARKSRADRRLVNDPHVVTPRFPSDFFDRTATVEGIVSE